MRPGPPAPDAVEEDEADALEGRTPTAGGAPSSSSRRWDALATGPRPPLGCSPLALPRRKAAVTDDGGEHVARDGHARPSPATATPKPKGVEASTQADDEPREWTSFDIGRSMSLLHSDNEAVVRRTLRRLHIRLWHHGAAKMSTLLKHAGAPSSALKLLPEIVGTCKICRVWKRPTPKSITNTRLAEKFNEAVQWDILFYKKNMISHLLDEAIRWFTASLLTSKDAPSLMTAISQDWVRPFGGPRVLIADGEKGFCSEQVAQFLDRCNTQLKSKAPGEHSQMGERHHELLRHCL